MSLIFHRKWSLTRKVYTCTCCTFDCWITCLFVNRPWQKEDIPKVFKASINIHHYWVWAKQMSISIKWLILILFSSYRTKKMKRLQRTLKSLVLLRWFVVFQLSECHSMQEVNHKAHGHKCLDRVSKPTLCWLETPAELCFITLLIQITEWIFEWEES